MIYSAYVQHFNYAKKIFFPRSFYMNTLFVRERMKKRENEDVYTNRVSVGGCKEVGHRTTMGHCPLSFCSTDSVCARIRSVC